MIIIEPKILISGLILFNIFLSIYMFNSTNSSGDCHQKFCVETNHDTNNTELVEIPNYIDVDYKAT